MFSRSRKASARHIHYLANHRFRQCRPRESAGVARPSRRRSGVNSASLKVIYLWFMEGRARHRKPKVSRLLGDEAERIIGRAQWTGGDIVYTSIPRGDKKKVCPSLSLCCLFSRACIFGQGENIWAGRIFRAETFPRERKDPLDLEHLRRKSIMRNLIRWENRSCSRYLCCGEHSVRSRFRVALVAISCSLTGLDTSRSEIFCSRDASMSANTRALYSDV